MSPVNSLDEPVTMASVDSEIVAFDFDERDPRMLEMLRLAVTGARRNGRKVGICGEAPGESSGCRPLSCRDRHRFDQREPIEPAAQDQRGARGEGSRADIMSWSTLEQRNEEARRCMISNYNTPLRKNWNGRPM
jgi:hypothetical protein